jgi:hypothetical protein
MTQREDAIRKLLTDDKHIEEGLSVNDVARLLDIPLESTRRYLSSMPDVYVAGWDHHRNPDGSLMAIRPFSIHRAVRVPKDRPPPPKKAERRSVDTAEKSA